MRCVHDFSTRKLNSKVCVSYGAMCYQQEELCIFRCAQKFLRHSARVNQRFQEQNALVSFRRQKEGEAEMAEQASSSEPAAH